MSEPVAKPRNQLHAYKGEMLTIAAIAKRVGLGVTTLRFRVDQGMTAEQAAAVPVASPTAIAKKARKASPWRNGMMFDGKKAQQ